MKTDPFLLRSLEHWIDSVNELTYQPVFCLWLSSEGHSVKSSIKDTSFEQGKDIISVDAKGDVHAYQLKGGKITLKRWRFEVKPEIEAMIDIPVKHPNIDKSKGHTSYLVVNDELQDSVRVEITDLNENKWKENPLKVYSRGDLLQSFQNIVSGMLPEKVEDYKKLSDLIFKDGTGFPDQAAISALIHKALKVNGDKLNKEEMKRSFATALIYVYMVAGPYQTSKNYVSVINILTLYISTLMLHVEKYQLEDKYWLSSYEIAWSDILENSQRLQTEVFCGSLSNLVTGPHDKDLVPFRKHAAVSHILTFKLSQMISEDPKCFDFLTKENAAVMKNSITLWGEASLLPQYISALLYHGVPKFHEVSVQLVKNVMSTILEFNGRSSKHDPGLNTPYWDLDYTVKVNHEIEKPFRKEDTKQSSFYLKPTLEMLVRMGQRDFLSEKWKELSFMHYEEFVPDDINDLYLLRADKGELRTVLYPKEASWSVLQEQANKSRTDSLPKLLQRFPEYLPYFLITFPWRVNSDSLGFLHSTVRKTNLKLE